MRRAAIPNDGGIVAVDGDRGGNLRQAVIPVPKGRTSPFKNCRIIHFGQRVHTTFCQINRAGGGIGICFVDGINQVRHIAVHS